MKKEKYIRFRKERSTYTLSIPGEKGRSFRTFEEALLHKRMFFEGVPIIEKETIPLDESGKPVISMTNSCYTYCPDILNKLFDYDSEKGIFIWKFRYPDRAYNATFNSRSANTQAFTSKDSHGYAQTSVTGKIVMCGHHAAWVMVNGKIPEGMEIDHINGIRHDNRISNLRLVDRGENLHNINKLREDNTSGKRGISYKKECDSYHAYINKDGERINIGYFKTLDEAIDARRKKEIEMGYGGSA